MAAIAAANDLAAALNDASVAAAALAHAGGPLAAQVQSAVQAGLAPLVAQFQQAQQAQQQQLQQLQQTTQATHATQQQMLQQLQQIDQTQQAQQLQLQQVDQTQQAQQLQLQQLQQTTQATHATQQQMLQRLQQIEQAQQQAQLLALRTWNATCGDGDAQEYAVVPNAQGQLPPAALPPILSKQVLNNLTGPQLTQYCQHYGLQTPHDSQLRRQAIAKALNVKLFVGELQ